MSSKKEIKDKPLKATPDSANNSLNTTPSDKNTPDLDISKAPKSVADHSPPGTRTRMLFVIQDHHKQFRRLRLKNLTFKLGVLLLGTLFVSFAAILITSMVLSHMKQLPQKDFLQDFWKRATQPIHKPAANAPVKPKPKQPAKEKKQPAAQKNQKKKQTTK